MAKPGFRHKFLISKCLIFKISLNCTQIEESWAEKGIESHLLVLRITLMTIWRKQKSRGKGVERGSTRYKYNSGSSWKRGRLTGRQWSWDGEGHTCERYGETHSSNRINRYLKQGKNNIWDHSWTSSLGNWDSLLFTQAGECKLVAGLWGWDDEFNFGHALWVHGEHPRL